MHSFENSLETSEQSKLKNLSLAFTGVVRIWNTSIFWDQLEAFSKTSRQLALRKANWISTAIVVEQSIHCNPRNFSTIA